MRRTLFAIFLAAAGASFAQQWNPASYDIGSPTWQDLWVNPASGNDAASGATSNQALRSVTEAWSRIPMGETLTNHAYRIRLLPGLHTNVPVYWESRHGTPSCPVLLAAEGANGAVTLPDLNIFDCRHLYFTGIRFDKTISGGDGFHLERCEHVLLRQCIITGNGLAHEALKANQCRHLYIEECDISGGDENAIDFVAVQYGHITRSRIHGAGDWAMYVKGGSAQILIDANEIYDAFTGGITAGQGTGFEYMETPWLHYEAYDVKIVNNFIHDTYGAGFGVNGGYNILLAHNTLVRVGERSHLIEVVHGGRSCDGDTVACESNRVAGGWGTANPADDGQFIPNRNVYIFNNIVYNPAPMESQWHHFTVFGGMTTPTGANLVSPARADDGLIIRGNVIWDGAPAHSVLGGEGCPPGHPTCNEAQLLAENDINEYEPQFVNAAGGDFRPVITGNLFRAVTYEIPDFPGGDAPSVPPVPVGQLDNEVVRERNGHPRHRRTVPPGAWTGGSSLRMTGLAENQIELQGEAGYRYAIERTTGAGNWQSLVETNLTTGTTLQASIPQPDPAAWLRARLVP